MFTKIKTAIRAHKAVSIVAVIVLAGGGYWWYSANAAPATSKKYVVAAASQGTIVSSISATGQVQAGTTVNVTPKVSETVTSIPVAVGQHVAAGQLLVQLDPTNEENAVSQDQLALQQAELSLQETEQVSTTTLIQDQNALTSDEQSATNASTTLVDDYRSGFNNLGPVFVNLQTVMAGLNDFVQGNDLSRTQEDPDAFVALMPDYLQASVQPYEAALEASYQAAETAYEQNLVDYHAVSSTASEASMDAIFNETLNDTQTISNGVKAAKDFLDYIVNTYPASSSSTKPLPTITTTLQGNFDTYTATMSSQVSGVQSAITTIANDKNSIINTAGSLNQASETLAELIAGPTQTTITGQQLSIESAQNNLTNAQQNLADTSVRAPISGTVSALSAVVGETAGSNVVTIVGDGELAEVTLNEIDAAKVQLGDPATLTFDALPSLSLAGTIVEIDPVGTVSQGVVNYNVQIGFSQPADTSSTDQVKPGMSVTANIVTDVAQNVIAVPNSAVTTANGVSYIMEPASPLSASDLSASENGGITLTATKMVPVTTGITNDTMTEIASGVNVGDQIITQTIKSSAGSGSAGSSGGNALQLLGGGGGARTFGGGGGGFRAGGGG